MTQSWKGTARKGAVLAGAIALLTAIAGQAASAGTPDATTGTDSGCTTPSAATPVKPLEQVPTGQGGGVIALLPSEDQKFVAGPGDDHELLWWLLGGEYTHGGVDLDEGQLSLGGYESTQAEEQGASNHVFTGAWKVECGPSKIEIDLDGEIHEAELLELEDRPGWGTYHLDVQITEVPSHVITLYGPDGEVLDTVDHPEVREIPQMPDADAVGNAVEVADVDDLGHADVDG